MGLCLFLLKNMQHPFVEEKNGACLAKSLVKFFTFLYCDSNHSVVLLTHFLHTLSLLRSFDDFPYLFPA